MVFLVVMIALTACTEKTFIVEDLPTNSIDAPIYFGDVNEISYPEGMNYNENEHCEILVKRLKNIRTYLAENKERLGIKNWHQFKDIAPLIPKDSIPLETNIISFDGEDTRQIGTNNGYDYFWKNSIWWNLWRPDEIVEQVVQKSDYSEGNHIFRPVGITSKKDSIQWSKKNDSITLRFLKTEGWEQVNIAVRLNTKTKSGKLEYSCKDCSHNFNKDTYTWNQNGSGSYQQFDLKNKQQTDFVTWE